MARLRGILFIKKSLKKGFTLIELVVVMLFIVITAGMAIPALYERIEIARLDRAAEELASKLEYARRMAVLQRRPYQLRVNDEENRFELFCYQRREDQKDFFPIANRFAYSRSWPVSWRVGGTKIILFDTRGRTPPAEITLVHPKRGGRVVSIPEGFSRVSIKKS